MKIINIIMFSLLVIGFSAGAMAADPSAEKASSTQGGKVISECIQNMDESKGSVEEARSGCCSHHDGVCGCSNGRQVCCDGSYSPSCTCNKLDAPQPAI